MAAHVPLGAGEQPLRAAVWLALFGAGTIVAMALIAGAAGWSLRRTVGCGDQYSARTMRHIVTVAGAASIVVGILWLAQPVA